MTHTSIGRSCAKECKIVNIHNLKPSLSVTEMTELINEDESKHAEKEAYSRNKLLVMNGCVRGKVKVPPLSLLKTVPDYQAQATNTVS